MRQHPRPLRAEFAQQFGHSSDQTAFDAQYFLVELGDLTFRLRDRNNRAGIGIGRGAKRWIVDRERPHALGRLLGAGGIVRQQGRINLVLRPKQTSGSKPVGHRGDRRFEALANGWQRRDQFGAACKQSGNALDSVAVVRQSLRHAVDHVLLLGRELEPRLLQQRTQCRRGLSDPVGSGAGISDDIAGREPQFVHAPVDVLGQVADTLHPLKFGKGLVDVSDGDDAGHAGRRNDGQQQQEAAKGQLTDRKRERAYPLDESGKGHGYRHRLRAVHFYTPESAPRGTCREPRWAPAAPGRMAPVGQ